MKHNLYNFCYGLIRASYYKLQSVARYFKQCHQTVVKQNFHFRFEVLTAVKMSMQCGLGETVTIRSNILPPSSGRQKGLRNFSFFPQVHTALQPRRPASTKQTLNNTIGGRRDTDRPS
jgi:hypothetical protein